MGISNGIKLFDYFLPSVTLSNLKLNSSCNISIDGNIFLYSGLGGTDISNQQFVNNNICATNCYRNISSIINNIKNYVGVDRCIIYFDGESPNMKFPTQMKRKNTVLMNCNLTVVKNEVINLFKEDNEYEIDHLNVGESENCMFLKRDVTKPNILVTKDSDIFNITIDYKKETENDEILIYIPQQGKIYNINNYNLFLPKQILKFLMILCGTDFNDNLFTFNMVINIIEAVKHKNDFNFPNYEKSKIEEIIAKLLHIAIIEKNVNRIVFPIKKATLSNYMSINEVINQLDWVFRYMTKGIYLEDYNADANNLTYNKHEFLLHCYNSFYKTKFNDLTKLRNSLKTPKRKSEESKVKAKRGKKVKTENLEESYLQDIYLIKNKEQTSINDTSINDINFNDNEIN